MVAQSVLSSTKKIVGQVNRKRRGRRMIRRWLSENARLRDAESMLSDTTFRQYREDINKFWVQHYDKPINPLWHLAYTKATTLKDVRHIPGNIWREEILPFFNDMELRPAFLDKNLSDTFLVCENAPRSVIKRMHGAYYLENNVPSSRADAENALKTSGDKQLIIKSSRTDNGIGIRELTIDKSMIFLNNDQCTLDDLEKYYGHNFLVQEKIVQHPVMARIHPASLNTIRVVTFRWKNKICLLKTFCRFGTAGHLNDNLATGGLGCGIDQEGWLYDLAIDATGREYSTHPTTHYAFAEPVQVPSYDRVCKLALDLHEHIFHFDIVSWDIAIGIDGNPIFLEANFQGVMDIAQVICREPLFGALTEEVLETVKDSRSKKS